jgi:hypothetical protein
LCFFHGLMTPSTNATWQEIPFPEFQFNNRTTSGNTKSSHPIHSCNSSAHSRHYQEYGLPVFFVSHSIGANDAQEWHLARVAFHDSVSIYPSCTLDGRFLFEFYICHPANWCYNAVSQRYWIQFHGCEDMRHPSLFTETHLVCPSETSDNHAKRHNLLPFQKWLNITHTDTYIHGPFEFTTVRG